MITRLAPSYALPDLGRSLLIPISALGAWAYGHRDAIDAARLAFDARAAHLLPADD